LTHPSKILTTTPGAFKFSTKLFGFKLSEAYTFFSEKDSDPEIDDKMKTGFTELLKALNLYLDLQRDIRSADECKITVYGSVTLENLAIARANSKYYGKPWFSNVSVRMDTNELFEYASDKGICYGQVMIYLFNIKC
jgi:hypothetical protein